MTRLNPEFIPDCLQNCYYESVKILMEEKDKPGNDFNSLSRALDDIFSSASEHWTKAKNLEQKTKIVENVFKGLKSIAQVMKNPDNLLAFIDFSSKHFKIYENEKWVDERYG